MVHPVSWSKKLIQHDTRSQSHSGSLQTPLSDSLDKQPTAFPPTQSATLSHRLPAVQLKATERVFIRASSLISSTALSSSHASASSSLLLVSPRQHFPSFHPYVCVLVLFALLPSSLFLSFTFFNSSALLYVLVSFPLLLSCPLIVFWPHFFSYFFGLLPLPFLFLMSPYLFSPLLVLSFTHICFISSPQSLIFSFLPHSSYFLSSVSFPLISSLHFLSSTPSHCLLVACPVFSHLLSRPVSPFFTSSLLLYAPLLVHAYLNHFVCQRVIISILSG